MRIGGVRVGEGNLLGPGCGLDGVELSLSIVTGTVGPSAVGMRGALASDQSSMESQSSL